MSLTLLNSRCCRQCNSNFSSFYDLIAHFETTHLQDIILAEQKRKEEDSAPNRSSGTNLPLSYYYRLFPDADPPKPVPLPPPTRLPFCIYRKRPAPGQNVDFSHTMAPVYSHSHPQGSARRKDDSRTVADDDESNISEADLEEADPGDPNVSLRFRCQIPSCGKQYKNVHGVRHHMMMAHGEDKTQHSAVPTEGPPTKNGRPFKCSQCNKRYKSQAGLNSHVAKEHIRTADASGHISAPMSPAPQMEQKIGQGMRPIASQPQLSQMPSFQQGYQPNSVPLAQGSISHPAPNVQVRQLPPPVSNEQGQVSYQQFQEYPANQPTGAVLQAHLAQRRAQQLNAQYGGQPRAGIRTTSYGV
ncbi:unnamed protein product, partial [Mesorhabditis belari]|uniref:C2H2-type domain-containing protein n=1 Tax=Mesorhabditis belari TaxID=2138241 RepID=A0AAF3FBQ8_9BILA